MYRPRTGPYTPQAEDGRNLPKAIAVLVYCVFPAAMSTDRTAESSKPPVSVARRRPSGTWYVEVTWQNGRREEIGNYSTAVEAEEFIKAQLESWREGQRRFTQKSARENKP
jgi:hypothetical protein